MEVGSGEEGSFESKQGHVGSGLEGRKEIEGSVFSSLNTSQMEDVNLPHCRKISDIMPSKHRKLDFSFVKNHF